MRITKDPEERRQEILRTALRLFCEQGYEQTSMSDIAQAMHVAQGLCYRYFPSKEALFDAAVDDYAQLLADRCSAILREAGLSLREIVERMPSFLDTETADDAAYPFFHGPEKGKVHERLSLAVCAKLVPLVKSVLERAVERGELVPLDTETAAAFCVYGQLGVLLRDDVPGEERVRRIKSFLIELVPPA